MRHPPRARRPGHATCAPTPTARRWSGSGGRWSCTSRPRTPPIASSSGCARRAWSPRSCRRRRSRCPRTEFERVGGRPHPVPDGGLLPRPAPPVRRADGRPRAGRRQVELRPREPRAAAEGATTLDVPGPWQPREDEIDERGPRRPRRDGPATPSAATARAGSPSPRTRRRRALTHFVEHRLPHFGRTRTRCCTTTGRWRTRCCRCRSTSACCIPLDAVRRRRGGVPGRRRRRWPRVEGFVRQVLGWREYMWHLYWHFGPGYPRNNALGATRRCPTGGAELDADAVTAACLRTALEGVRDRGWTHHIQRLMVLGNHALQRGYRPARAVGLVPRGVRRRLRVGDADQRHRHEPARRRRAAGDQAVRLGRRLHQPDVRPLRRLRVRPEEAARRRRLPVHRRLLGLGRTATASCWPRNNRTRGPWRRWTGWRTWTRCWSRKRHERASSSCRFRRRDTRRGQPVADATHRRHHSRAVAELGPQPPDMRIHRPLGDSGPRLPLLGRQFGAGHGGPVRAIR